MTQLLLAIVGLANAALVIRETVRSYRRRACIVMLWALCTVFGLALTADGLLAPIHTTIGQNSHSIEADVFLRALIFMLLFNAGMIAGARLVEHYVRFPANRAALFSPRPYAPGLRYMSYALAVVLIPAAAMYFMRLASYGRYDDRYHEVGSAWDLVFVVACWAILPISMIFRQRPFTFLAVGVGLVLVYLSKVRYFGLFYIVPALLIWILSVPQSRASRALGRARKRLVAGAAVLAALAALAVVINQGRSSEIGRGNAWASFSLPELELTRGYALIAETYDGQRLPLGPLSYERLAAGFAFPYLYMFTNYEYPPDPPYQFARDLGGRDYYNHLPCLLYGDAIAALGPAGVLLGLFWGMLYTSMDYLLSKPSVCPFFLPYFVWFVYMSYRGAVGNTIAAIPREFYFNAALAWAFWLIAGARRGARRSWSIAYAHADGPPCGRDGRR